MRPTSRRIVPPPLCSKKGSFPLHRTHKGRAELQTPCPLRRPRQAFGHEAHGRPGKRLQRSHPARRHNELPRQGPRSLSGQRALGHHGGRSSGPAASSARLCSCLPTGPDGAHGGTDGLSLVASIKVAGDGAAQRLAQKVAVQQIGQRLARLSGLLVEPVEILGLLLEKARVAWVSFSILNIAGYRACWPARFYPATRRKWCVAGQRSGSAPPAPQPPARPCDPAP